jgi:hypothetical protein
VLIVSRHDPDPPRALVIYVPPTGQKFVTAFKVGSLFSWDAKHWARETARSTAPVLIVRPRARER